MAGPTKKEAMSTPLQSDLRSTREVASPSRHENVGMPAEPDPDLIDPLGPLLGHSTWLEPVLNATWPGSHRSYLSPNVQDGLRFAARFFADRAPGEVREKAQISAEGILFGLLMIRPAACRWVGGLIDTLAAHEFVTAAKVARQDRSPPNREEPDFAATLLRWDAVRLLHQASTLRRETNPTNETIGVRHIWLGALFLREGQLALESLGLMEAGINALVEALVETVRSERISEYSDDPAAWDEVIQRARSQPLLIQTRRLQSGFSPDVIEGGTPADREPSSDPLGTRRDAVALADLILLEAAKPPLAIGLLGSWGSGKSTLMSRLREEIQRQIESQQKAADRSGPSETRRVRNVAQLTFNAWSFADSKNLWASLTAEIFDQLRAGGSDAMRGERGEALVKEVADKLATHGEPSVSTPSTASIQKDLDRLENDARIKKLKAEAAQLHAVTVGELVTGDATAFATRLRKALTGDQDAIAMDAHGRGVGRIWWLAKRMYPGWLRAAALVAAIVLPTAVAVLILVPDKTWGMIATAAPLLTALAMAGKPIVTALGTAAKYDELVHRRKAKLAQEAAELQNQIEAKRTELTRAHQEEQKRAVTVATLAETKGHPARLLQYLLSESTDIQSIKAQVGLMATVRRCFETLDELIRRHIRLAREEAESPNNPGRKGEHEKGRDQGPAIERIILYVDDLDRCSAEQVVKVLEAVHLLLAFECFVVIVAIDARWLYRSLLISHPQFQRGNGPSQAEQRESPERAQDDSGLPSPSDYLEKIFQIPFWVRPLKPPIGGSDFSPQASAYTRYLDSLLGRRPVGPGEGVGGEVTDRDGRALTSNGEVLMPMPPDAPDAIVDDLRARRERVALNTDERDLLDELGPLAARSPRAIKRLVNIYRLIKASVPQTHVLAFEGRGSQETASFGSILFVLALDAGLRADTVATVHLALERISNASWESLSARPESLYFDAEGLDDENPSADAQLVALLRALIKADALAEFIAGLTALRKARSAPLDRQDLIRAFATTQRYSFRTG